MELSAVVVIVGILAVLAVVGYRKYFGAAKFAEAVHLVNATRTGQAAYLSERGFYADISLTCNANGTYPARNPGRFKTDWGAPCTVCKQDMSFATIGVVADAPVQFGYATVASRPGCDPACRGAVLSQGGQPINWGPKAQTDDWYIVHAIADFGDGPVHVIGSSFTNEIITGKP